MEALFTRPYLNATIVRCNNLLCSFAINLRNSTKYLSNAHTHTHTHTHTSVSTVPKNVSLF